MGGQSPQWNALSLNGRRSSGLLTDSRVVELTLKAVPLSVGLRVFRGLLLVPVIFPVGQLRDIERYRLVVAGRLGRVALRRGGQDSVPVQNLLFKQVGVLPEARGRLDVGIPGLREAGMLQNVGPAHEIGSGSVRPSDVESCLSPGDLVMTGLPDVHVRMHLALQLIEANGA